MSILERRNAHLRDRHITFIKEPHKYLIETDKDGDFISVTTLIGQQFPEFNADEAIDKMMAGRKWKEGHKWWGWSREALKIEWDRIKEEASKEGETLHSKIEHFMNNEQLEANYTFKELIETVHEEEDLAWNQFLNFVRDFPWLEPYRTEWRIYHEEAKIAGSIDLVCKIKGSNLFILIDYKRSKEIKHQDPKYRQYSINSHLSHLSDDNFTHYALQQNMYSYILKEKYGIQIIKMFLVKVHPESKNYELLEIPDLTKEIFILFESRKEK
jgi:hypothetical protein